MSRSKAFPKKVLTDQSLHQGASVIDHHVRNKAQVNPVRQFLLHGVEEPQIPVRPQPADFRGENGVLSPVFRQMRRPYLDEIPFFVGEVIERVIEKGVEGGFHQNIVLLTFARIGKRIGEIEQSTMLVIDFRIANAVFRFPGILHGFDTTAGIVEK